MSILDMFASPEAVAKASEAGIVEKKAIRYVDSKAAADAIVEFVELSEGKSENPKSLHVGQPYLYIKMKIVEGTVGLSEKAGGSYTAIEGGEGDEFSLYFNLSERQKPDDITRTFQRLCRTVAAITDNKASDFASDGPLAGQVLSVLREVEAGTQFRLTQLRDDNNPNAKGYYNNLTIEPVPTAPAAKKSKKAS